MPTMHEIVSEMARYVWDSGYDIEHDTDLEPYICIYDVNTKEPVATLRYNEYESYVGCAHVWIDQEGIDEGVALAAMAKGYIDCL